MDTYNPESMIDRRALATAIVHALNARGFATCLFVGGERVAFARPSGHTEIMVYTTVEGNAVRAVGTDAIRVVLGFRDDRGPMRHRKIGRVFRVGTIDAIIGRLLARVEEAMDRAACIPAPAPATVTATVAKPAPDATIKPATEPAPDAFRPLPFADPFGVRTLSFATPAPAPKPCADGWEHYGAKERCEEGSR
jgi:hypothetical protein